MNVINMIRFDKEENKPVTNKELVYFNYIQYLEKNEEETEKRLKEIIKELQGLEEGVNIIYPHPSIPLHLAIFKIKERFPEFFKDVKEKC